MNSWASNKLRMRTMFAHYLSFMLFLCFQDELTSRVMEQLRKKDRDSLLAEIQELRKTSMAKPLIDQVKLTMKVYNAN